MGAEIDGLIGWLVGFSKGWDGVDHWWAGVWGCVMYDV